MSKWMKSIILLFITLIHFNSGAVDHRKLQLIGEGEYTFLFMSVYHAKMWASNSKDLYLGDVKLELKYNMSFKGRDIVEQTHKEFLNAGIKDEDAKKWIEPLKLIFPNVKKGDRIVASYKTNDRIIFYLNDVLIGKIQGNEFSKAFLNIWLGPKSSDSKLRDRLIGKER